MENPLSALFEKMAPHMDRAAKLQAEIELATARAVYGEPSIIRITDDGLSITPIPLADFYNPPEA